MDLVGVPRAHYTLKRIQLCLFYFFFEPRPHTGFLPTAATSGHHPPTQPTRCRHSATAVLCPTTKIRRRNMFLQWIWNCILLLLFIITLKFGIEIPLTADCRLLTADQVPSTRVPIAEPVSRVLVAPRPPSVTPPSVRARRVLSARVAVSLVSVPSCPTHVCSVCPKKT